MSDDKSGARSAMLLQGLVIIITNALVAFSVLMNPDADLVEVLARAVAAWALVLLLIGFVFAASVAWRPCVVLVMTPLTAWNNAMRSSGDWGCIGEAEAPALVMLQAVVLIVVMFVGLAVYGPRTELVISPVVFAWVFLPSIAILIGVLCRTTGPVARSMRRAYAETEAELYGRAADDGDERKGGLTEAGRE